MDKLKSLIILFICLILVGFFMWAMLPRDDYTKKVSEKLKSEKKKADVIFKDATLAEVYEGIKYWELVAKSSVINNSIGKADLTIVDGLFFEKGKPTIKFLAPTAVWHIKKNDILLNDPIGFDIKYENIVRSELAKVNDITRLRSVFHLPGKVGNKYEGYWFAAKNLNWRLSTKKLICTGSITLTKGDILINSEKLMADVGLENVVLTGHPSGEIYSDSRKVDISADRFLVDSYKDIITADQNVVITRNGSRITATKAVYDQKAGIIVLSGDVFLTDGTIKAYSKNASYDINSNRISLLDKAKANRDGNEVYGEKMTILLGQNKIMIEGRAKAKIKESELR